MLFRDRLDAGRQLAHALAAWHGARPLVLAIPRGATPMARVVAEALGGELDVVLVRKLGAPGNPEFAIGAVDETGEIVRTPDLNGDALPEGHLARERDTALALLRRRRALYTPGRDPVDVHGRVVIVVDDGLATGSTMLAALRSLRRQAPERLICAIPVAPRETLERVRAGADEVMCLATPEPFHAVGQFYDDFTQVDDTAVVSALRTALPPPGPIRLDLPDVTLEGELTPGDGRRMVLFAHGSGSSRHSPRNREVAKRLDAAGIGTLLFDLLTPDEDSARERRFDIPLLTERLRGATVWLRTHGPWQAWGYFGASTGAAAALRAAAGGMVDAVVARGGRPDLAGDAQLARVSCPTLLLVGDRDTEVLALNRLARDRIGTVATLVTIPGASHLFEEPGALERVATLACDWFRSHLPAGADARVTAGEPGTGIALPTP